MKSDKCIPDLGNSTELFRRIADGAVLQLQKLREFFLVQFSNAFLDILIEYKFQKRL